MMGQLFQDYMSLSLDELAVKYGNEFPFPKGISTITPPDVTSDGNNFDAYFPFEMTADGIVFNIPDTVTKLDYRDEFGALFQELPDSDIEFTVVFPSTMTEFAYRYLVNGNNTYTRTLNLRFLHGANQSVTFTNFYVFNMSEIKHSQVLNVYTDNSTVNDNMPASSTYLTVNKYHLNGTPW